MGTHRLLHHIVRTARQQAVALLDAFVSLLLRHRRIQLIVVTAVSLATGAMTYSMNNAASSARERWVSGVEVLVTASDVSKGDIFNSTNTRVVDLPEAAIADDALVNVSPGTRARVSLAANTALTRSLVDDANDSVPIPEGWRGVALPLDLVAPVLAVGNRVDVIANNQVVSTNALVVEATSTRGITIAVPANDAAIVASASQAGDVSLILTQ